MANVVFACSLIAIAMVMMFYQQNKRIEEVSADNMVLKEMLIVRIEEVNPQNKMLNEMLNKRIEDISNKVLKEKLSNSRVAFMAVRTSGVRVEEDPKTVTYDLDVTSVGGWFNKDTGTFTAPRRGVYSFNFHGNRQLNDETNVQLERNGKVVSSSYIDMDYNENMITMSATLLLEVRDTIEVRVYAHTKWESQYVSFSGVIVFPVD